MESAPAVLPASEADKACRAAQKELPAPTFEQAKAQTDAAQQPPKTTDANTQQKPGQPTSHIRNTRGELIAWDVVHEQLKKRVVREVAEEFALRPKTIYEKARRNKWKILDEKKLSSRKTLAKKVHDEIMKKGIDKVDWNKLGEGHRQTAFRIANASVAKFKPRAPKNFRELESADKIARRAAGLETAEVVNNTLIAVNELIDEAEPQVLEAREVPPAIEAEVTPSDEPQESPPPSSTESVDTQR